MSLRRQLTAGAIVARANLTVFERPDRLARAMLAMQTVGGDTGRNRRRGRCSVSGANRDSRRRRFAHVRGLWNRSQSVAHGLAAAGVGPGSCVGLLCRNHRGFVESLAAVSATGAGVVLLNTGFAGPQLADVIEHEGITHVIHDDEFTAIVPIDRVEAFDEAASESLATAGNVAVAQRVQGRVVILTSGTTGRPKGAERRSDPAAIEGVAALLERVPFRLGDTQVIAAPLFHAWGLTHLMLGLGRCTTNVLARTFDAESALRSVAEHRAEVFAVVPVMLSRILSLPTAVLDASPTPQLRVIASSGSALGSALATEALDRFGPVLFNFYGSTEVAIATVATPDDLRQAPSTAGRVAFGVKVEIVDDDGDPVPEGTVGRVFVGGSMRFEGYTTGGGKEEFRGLLSSGDLGHFDDGLLFLDGRDDDMIVSGGENVFPIEVEDLLGQHPDIAEVAVVGVADERFGQALAAFVVTRPGSSLTGDDVRTFVRDRLARHKTPRQVEFIEELPRNTTGKILRRTLIDAAGAGTGAGSP